MIKGIKNLFQEIGFTPELLEGEDFFDYGLWHKNAEYTIRFEKFNNGWIEISLHHDGKDVRPHHIYADYNEILEEISKIEAELLSNYDLSFHEKIMVLWNRLENGKFSKLRRKQ